MAHLKKIILLYKQYSDWMLQVMWLALTNQSALFLRRAGTLVYNYQIASPLNKHIVERGIYLASTLTREIVCFTVLAPVRILRTLHCQVGSIGDSIN